MVRLRKVQNSFERVTVKSEDALNAFNPSVSGTRLLSWPQVEDRICLSRTTAWRRMREGAFPRPIRISKGRVAWVEDEIVSWINKHIEAANTS
jgi:prophage regulatory protein